MEALANPKHLSAMGVWVGGMAVGARGDVCLGAFLPRRLLSAEEP